MKFRILFLLLINCFLFLGCSENEKVKTLNYDSNLTYKYKSEIMVYYAEYNTQRYIVYSNNEIYSCSFQGTNFLLEKNNSEELFSTTAPIQIISTEKNDENK